MPQRPTQPRARPASSPFRDQPPPVYDTFEVDSRVIHDRHGLGRVLCLKADRMDVKFGNVVMDIDTHSPKVHLL
ncbi:hypothetical protein [Lapillicoccus sp.]|uniref:hypothetical protein n=1 Tax=Lapillicoccus sp. TaxID=1909287 RepID=UPI0027BECFBD|nr:hypothetical protein [Actinomycetota bacterium]MDQ2796694.1 hypothetical protein [Actinomycetota bacterium]